MEILTFDKYLTKPKEESYLLFLNEKNLKILRVILYICTFIFFITLISQLASSNPDYFDIILFAIVFLTLSFFSFKYKKFVNVENVKQYITILLLGSLGVIILAKIVDIERGVELPELKERSGLIMIPETEPGKSGVTIKTTAESTTNFGALIILTLLIFRLERRQIVEIFCYAFFTPIVLHFIILQNFTFSNDLGDIIMSLVFFGSAIYFEKKRRVNFYKQYDFYYKRSFDSLRMKKELDYARQIQLSMLPENNATIYDLEIAGISNPASEVGGDYFDYFHISKNKVGVFICDVSGHGVASGLMLAGLRSGMHLILEDTSEPTIVIEKLNRMVRKTQSRKMFVTAIFAVIDLEKNTCRLFNAGHLPPYKISGNTGEIFKIRNHGITLGAVDNISNGFSNEEVTIEFSINDKLLFYTDGVNEAMNNKKEEYGFENIEKIIQMHSDKKPTEIVEHLCNDIKSFINETSQRDDLTILSIGRVSN